MLTKFKNNFRILPVFIFLAVLTLSIRVNNVFDSLKNADSRSFSISQSKAWAEEEASRDTAELGKVLEQAERGQNPGSTGEKANSTFTQSEIMILQELAERLSLKEIQFKNLIQTEEECIEWHVIYEDEDMNTWKFDMIHIRKGSKYDGVVEKVTAAITNRLTPEIKNTILQIKFDVPDGVQIPGIEIYHVVFVGGVCNYEELK